MARLKFTFKRLRMDLDEEVGTSKRGFNFGTDEETEESEEFSFETEEEEETGDGEELFLDAEQPNTFQDGVLMQSFNKRQRDDVYRMQNSCKKPRLGQIRGAQAEKRGLSETESAQLQVPRPVSRLAHDNSSPKHENSCRGADDAAEWSRKVSGTACGVDTVEKPQVIVMRGDPTDWSTGAIVSGTNSLLHHNCGLAATIVRKGGQGIQRQSTEWVFYHGEVRVGSAMWTTAGKLSSKFIIHTVGPDVSNHRWPTTRHQLDLRRAVRSALEVADGLNVKSVTIPAISTGVSGYPKYLAAREIVAECLKFCGESPLNSLRLIILMNEGEVATSIFAQALKEAQQQRLPQRHWAGIVGGEHSYVWNYEQ